MKIREDLKYQWEKLVSKYSNNEKLIGDTFNSIKECYNAHNRYYHNLDHIEKMLLESNKFREKVVDYDSILFAIWFHDIIYDTKKSDNEEKSAEYAENFLNKLNYNKIKIKKVKQLILKTKNHQIDEKFENFDTKLFLDLDLLILGAKPEIYREYVEAVRKEYDFVPDNVFNVERLKILTNLLNQAKIFETKNLNDKYEKSAKINIQSEMNLLKSRKRP